MLFMALFYAAIKRDSVPRLRFHFLSHAKVFSCTISLVCCLKYKYSCFSTLFCFLVFFVFLFGFRLSSLVLAAIVNLSLLFFVYSSSLQFAPSTQFSMPMSPLLPSFLGTQSLSMSSLGCIIINFLVLLSLWYSSSLVLFTNPSARAGYDTRSIFKRSLTGLNSEFSFS